MDTTQNLVHGAGLGLRRSFLSRIVVSPPEEVGFYEVAPENWITIGGKLGKQFRAMTERFDFICHGLSLSIGSTDPLDEKFVRDVKMFMAEHQIKFYSEHLSYCSKDGHLYDLMPIPFTSEAVTHVAGRIRRVQDIMEQKIAIENVSYYAAPGQEMDEIDFFNAVIEEADCDVLIDINNIYVNSVNHGYDAEAFLKAMPAHRVAYAHIAGHYVEAEDFLVDTHGADVIDPVWNLLGKAYELYGVFPTLLERDFNIPAMDELIKEVNTISAIQAAWENNMQNSLPEAGMSVDFKAKQLEFAAYIRDPEKNPPPADVPPQRMAMYRELFFNNIDSFLSANFPVLRAILNDRQWFELGQDFFAKHVSLSPHFSEIPEEFLDYLQNERDSSDDFPFMLELAHYEWVEMALSISKEASPVKPQGLDNLQNQRIQLSPLAWPLVYQYPVHKISPDFLPETAPEQATFLIIYRNSDDEVNFIEITPITYRLLQIIQEHEGMMTADYLRLIAEESKHPNPEIIMAGGLQILKELAEKTVVF